LLGAALALSAAAAARGVVRLACMRWECTRATDRATGT
jgi:hypothetical protein